MFELIPAWYQYTIVFALGLIIGSFLDVVATRFHTGKSINGRSRCLSCGHTLTWYELFPLFSYAILRGRCKECHSHIPARLLFMELFTATVFLWVFTVSTSVFMSLISLVLISILIVVAVYDIRHMVIPDIFVLTVSLAVVIILGIKIGSFTKIDLLIPHIFSAFGAFAFYASLWFVSKGRWIGFGDAKLAIPFGLLLGPIGTFSFIIFSFWIGAAVSLVILGVQKLLSRGQKHLSFLRIPLTMKSEVPFAPFMIAAFVLVYLTHASVIEVMNTLLYATF